MGAPDSPSTASVLDRSSGPNTVTSPALVAHQPPSNAQVKSGQLHVSVTRNRHIVASTINRGFSRRQLAISQTASQVCVDSLNQALGNGDEAFVELTTFAFDTASALQSDWTADHQNSAAILACGVLMGHKKIAELAGMELSSDHLRTIDLRRRQVTLRGRSDLPRHYWVSTALTILASQRVSNTIGLIKEETDSRAGGSGFSFVDLLADRCGVAFARAATRPPSDGRINGVIRHRWTIADLFPSTDQLPEGLPKGQYEQLVAADDGGELQRIEAIIEARIQSLPVLTE